MDVPATMVDACRPLWTCLAVQPFGWATVERRINHVMATPPTTPCASVQHKLHDPREAGMAWTHDTGYGPAYHHTGYPAAITADGADIDNTADRARLTAGWRAACECGWRSPRVYSRKRWPSQSGLAPDAVDGWATGTATFRDWSAHLHTILPELAVHDLAQEAAKANADLDAAVHAARQAGTSWPRIADAAQISRRSAVNRWGTPSTEPARADRADIRALQRDR